MTQTESNTVRLKVAPEIARIVQPGAPRDVQLAAARGALPLAGKELLTVLFFLCNSQDAEIKRSAVQTVRELPARILLPTLTETSLPPQLLELLARARLTDAELMESVVTHPATTLKTLLLIAEKSTAEILKRLSGHQALLDRHPQLVAAIIANPAAEKTLKLRLGWLEPELQVGQEDELEPAVDADDEKIDLHEGRTQTEIEALMEQADREGMSKYQIALELKVAEKIKLGLTGDKEWRTILIKEANKLIQGAVMKNPRITDGEVLTVAKSRTSSDEIIRIILLNKDWLKSYEIRKALVAHPKTPLPKALRFVSALSLKDIKDLARSRQVSRAISTAARKELELRLKKSGG